MLENPMANVVSKPGSRSDVDEHLTERRLVNYLVECYQRCYNVIDRESTSTVQLVNDVMDMKALIVQNLATAFREPELYCGQKLDEQLREVLLNSYEVQDSLLQLMDKFAEKISLDEGSTTKLESLVTGVLNQLQKSISDTSMIIFSTHTIVPLLYFIKSPILAKIFIAHSCPKIASSGKAYEATLLGTILCKSCIPSSELGHWDYFQQPSGQPSSVHSRTEAQIWSGLESVHTSIHSIFNSLFRSSDEVKDEALSWLGGCLAANAGRGKMWTSQMGPLLSGGYASDGYMLNLGSMLLRFCAPLTENSVKMNKIDATYMSKAGGRMKGFSSETCIISLEEGVDKPASDTYIFPTEVFFMAHKAMDLGFRTVQEKFTKLNQELNRLQTAYRDATEGGGGQVAEEIQGRMEESMAKFLSMKAALLEPSTMEKQTSLVAATCSWMVKLATGSICPGPIEPMSDVPDVLSCVPEFLVENICEHILLVRRFNPSHFEQTGQRLPEIFTMILTFMGKPIWLKNPHLRARLAESLECLLPHHQNQSMPNVLGNFHRQALFQDDPGRLQLVYAILHVFVSIEETGQSVQFEQKFSYRRPMYDVIKYMWTLDDYKAKLSEMAEKAEKEIEGENPPLFLRFINLLVNDAIFLLDEGLNYMRTIQEQEGERDGWRNLSTQERTENERQYIHTGQLARYHNLMGSETIEVLELMTTGIKAVITHPTMTDRLAAMLNYFLKTLTGPERKNFKVKNLDKYSFKPGDVVAKITQIYINLGDSERFLSSVSGDGRSYSKELFSWTESVLLKIGRADLVSELAEIAKKVGVASSQQQQEEELLSDAPDEFLCPIMSILMLDPVILPSSKNTVDRSTIARHLLSDQSDPFNRSPLTMDQLKSDEALKSRIDEWIRTKRAKK